jgi:two-component system response regulator LytT
MLRVLAVDDELPALEEIAYLLRRDPRIGSAHTASDGASALKALEAEPVDALFLDIKMPGLDGLDIAKVLARFARPPLVVFVTAYDDFAVDAFELKAVDYVLKPVREERLAEAVRRVAAGRSAASAEAPPAEPQDETIAVELGGVTRFIARSDVRYVEAHGDYARLHTATGSHLVRVPLTTLEDSWQVAGFVRIHRSHLVALHHIDEVRQDSGRCSVRLGDEVLQVSRRHTRELRDLLVRRARPAREQP